MGEDDKDRWDFLLTEPALQFEEPGLGSGPAWSVVPPSRPMWVFAIRAAWWARTEGEALASASCLSSQEAMECALAVAADAQAPLRDVSWCERKQLCRQQVSTWALGLRVEDKFVLAALVDAIVFAEWLKDVSYFSPGADCSERLSWLAESPLEIDVARRVPL